MEEEFKNLEKSENPEENQHQENPDGSEKQKGTQKINKYSGQFLQTQIFNTSKRIKKVLSHPHKIKERHQTERDAIKSILEWKSEILPKKAIVVNIKNYLKKEEWWEEKRVTECEWKYWLWITIINLNSLIKFCKIHGFIPMVNKIIIESADPLEKKDLSAIFAQAINEIATEDSTIDTLYEIEHKYPKSIQPILKDIVYYLREIIHYNAVISPSIFWEKLEKNENIWALNENIFVEIALRLENQITEKVWIMSSSLKLAKFSEDINDKTDMIFRIRKTPKQHYQPIDMQFTTLRKSYQEDKERSVEKYLLDTLRNNDIEKKDKPKSFILLTVNWEYSKHVVHKNKSNENKNKSTIINEEYKDWTNNPEEREKYMGSKFPLFIDSIDPKLIQSAEVMYIALNMLYKKHNFRYTNEETYINSFNESVSIDGSNPSSINEIKLSDIWISKCSLNLLIDNHLGYEVLLKHKFEISYQWRRMWVIVIYEAEQNQDNSKKEKINEEKNSKGRKKNITKKMNRSKKAFN